MASRISTARPTVRAGVADFAGLGVRALLSGVAAALVLACATLVLAHNAQATEAAPSQAAAHSGR